MIAHRQEAFVRLMDNLAEILPLNICLKIYFGRTGQSSVRRAGKALDNLILRTQLLSLLEISAAFF